MSRNTENIEVKPEASNKSDEIDDVKHQNGQENSIVASESQKKIRHIQSSVSKVSINETRQQKMDPVDFAQQKIDSTKSNEIPLKSTKSLQQDLGSIQQSQGKIDSLQSSEEQAVIVVKYEENGGQGNQFQLTQTVQQYGSSNKLSRYFPLNLNYLIQVRGIANIIHMVSHLIFGPVTFMQKIK